MSGDKPQFKVRDKNILDSKRLTLTRPCPVKGVKGFSNLYYFAGGDNPGITVYTGDPNDKDNNFGRIQAKFGLMDMQIHLEQLLTVTNSKEPLELSIVCQSVRGQDKKKMDVARVIVAKTDAGLVTVMVVDLEKQGRPQIEFSFAPTYWHYLEMNGQRQNEAQVSVLVARAFVRTVSQLVNQVADRTYEHPKPKQQNGAGNGGGNRGSYGGGGGGNNRGNSNYGNGGGYNSNGGNGGGNGNYETSSGNSELDDDVPF